MTFQELYDKIADKVHRKDMQARIPKFVDDARVMINMRLGLTLTTPASPDDTDEILTDWPLLYYYAALGEQYEFIEEYETGSYFGAKWEREVDRYYITRAGTEPLVIVPGTDEEVAP